MWCSEYRWNIHRLACRTRLVGSCVNSINVCVLEWPKKNSYWVQVSCCFCVQSFLPQCLLFFWSLNIFSISRHSCKILIFLTVLIYPDYLELTVLQWSLITDYNSGHYLPVCCSVHFFLSIFFFFTFWKDLISFLFVFMLDTGRLDPILPILQLDHQSFFHYEIHFSTESGVFAMASEHLWLLYRKWH